MRKIRMWLWRKWVARKARKAAYAKFRELENDQRPRLERLGSDTPKDGYVQIAVGLHIEGDALYRERVKAAYGIEGN